MHSPRPTYIKNDNRNDLEKGNITSPQYVSFPSNERAQLIVLRGLVRTPFFMAAGPTAGIAPDDAAHVLASPSLPCALQALYLLGYRQLCVYILFYSPYA